jgi:hypothetical protein
MTNKENKVIPDHHSPVRHILNETQGETYQPIATLNEARNYENAYLVMEGDHGGQIYLVCPVKRIKCDWNTLTKLLIDIDKLEWNEELGRGIYFEKFNDGEIVAGGMGGGIATNVLWVHEGIHSIKDEISKVINGKKTRISVSRN